MVYSNTTVYEGNWYGKSGHLSNVTSLKHLCFEVQLFQGFIFKPY